MPICSAAPTRLPSRRIRAAQISSRPVRPVVGKLLSGFLGKTSKKYGTPYAALLQMAGVDGALVRRWVATLIVIDVFLLMVEHITIHISVVRPPW